jgi:hypothetical protein
MEIVNLLPLSRAEVRSKRPNFEKARGDNDWRRARTGRADRRLPRDAAAQRYQATTDMGTDYVKPIVRRDILDIADIEKLGQLPHGRLESSAHQG